MADGIAGLWPRAAFVLRRGRANLTLLDKLEIGFPPDPERPPNAANKYHYGCNGAPRSASYSGARSKILLSMTAPFNPVAAMCPPSAIRLRWASSQWRPSKKWVGLRLGPSMPSRQRALTVILSG